MIVLLYGIFVALGSLRRWKRYNLGLCFVFHNPYASYSGVRSRAGKPLLYTERLKAIVTEVFRIYLNVSQEYKIGILLKKFYSIQCYKYEMFRDAKFSN